MRMETEKKKIGIDIDEVVVELIKPFLKKYNKKFNKKISHGSVFSYSLWRVLDVSREDAINLLYDFYGSKEFERLKFVKGAKEGLERLSLEYRLFFITSRPEIIKEKTKNYFYHHFPKNGYEFIFSGDFFGGEKTKSEILNKLKIPLMIEDNADYALNCAKKDIKVFLLDKPWNQDYQEHENITKVKNWKEIMERLEAEK